VSSLLALSTPTFVAHWTLHPESMFSQLAAAAEEVEFELNYLPYGTVLRKNNKAAQKTVKIFQNASQEDSWYPSQPGMPGYESCMQDLANIHQTAKEHQQLFVAAARRTVQRLRTFCARHKQSHVSPQLAKAYFDDFLFGCDQMAYYHEAVSALFQRVSHLQPQCHSCVERLSSTCHYSMSNTRAAPKPRERKRDALKRYWIDYKIKKAST
jgi:hypothetical protein